MKIIRQNYSNNVYVHVRLDLFYFAWLMSLKQVLVYIMLFV